MKTQTENKNVLKFAEAKNIVLKNDYILIFLNDGSVIRKHVNFFKHILGVEYTPVTKEVAQQGHFSFSSTTQGANYVLKKY